VREVPVLDQRPHHRVGDRDRLPALRLEPGPRQDVSLLVDHGRGLEPPAGRQPPAPGLGDGDGGENRRCDAHEAKEAEPNTQQRSPPPTWGGIGWGVDEGKEERNTYQGNLPRSSGWSGR